MADPVAEPLPTCMRFTVKQFPVDGAFFPVHVGLHFPAEDSLHLFPCRY